MKYIVVQAGGKGTRLKHLTANKPKALVPVDNLPILFYLFKQFPDAKYIIIADYKADVMRQYLSAFADINYLVVDAHGDTGTCSGIGQAMEKLPSGETFMLIWSDLVLPDGINLPEGKGNYIGLSKGFPCRWRYRDNRFEEIPSDQEGVAGLFIFDDKTALQSVPKSGEFVRWLQTENRTFKPISLSKTREYGLLSTIEEREDGVAPYQCRPFNRIRTDERVGQIIKEGIDNQGRALAVREKAWYQFVEGNGFKNIPKIYSYDPLTMELIPGNNIYRYRFEKYEKTQLLRELINTIKDLHRIGEVKTDYFSIYEAYIRKTWNRLNKIRDLIPIANKETVVVNGKSCRNIFFHKDLLENRVARYRCDRFVLLHGDATFSNIVLDKSRRPVLIDPRGYFGQTELYGDPNYDWAKLYYSIVGNYDQFNQKRFRLTIEKDAVELVIESNGWEDMEADFFSMIGDEVIRDDIKLIHAIIWLSLTTYAWEDYDSICGAFYNGLYYLEDVL